MASILSFDEVNKLYEQNHAGNMRSMPYGVYFGEMDLSETQIRNRVNTAKSIYPFMVDAIATMYYMLRDGGFDYDTVARDMRSSYLDTLTRLGIVHTAFFDTMHVDSTVTEIVTATVNHAEDADPYFFTRDRATLIAENESNSIWNDSEFQQAVDNGNTRKRWSAIMDKRTRGTHVVANGQIVPIDQPFAVGESLLMYPRDASLGAAAEELVNCRCSAIFF